MLVCVPDFQVEVQLDSHKDKQKSAVKRALFIDSHQPLLQRSLKVRRGKRVCNQTKIYLRVCSCSLRLAKALLSTDSYVAFKCVLFVFAG